MDAFKFGRFIIFENKNLKCNREDLALVTGYSGKSYELDCSYSSNRTFIYKDRNETLVFQVVINITIFDVIIPTFKQKMFKDKILGELLEYIIYMIRMVCPEYYIANETGFKLNLYVEDKTPASYFDWWKLNDEKVYDKYNWRSELVVQTSLGKPLGKSHKRFLMKLEFNTSYHIKCYDGIPIKEKHSYSSNTQSISKKKSRVKLEQVKLQGGLDKPQECLAEQGYKS